VNYKGNTFAIFIVFFFQMLYKGIVFAVWNAVTLFLYMKLTY